MFIFYNVFLQHRDRPLFGRMDNITFDLVSTGRPLSEIATELSLPEPFDCGAVENVNFLCKIGISN